MKKVITTKSTARRQIDMFNKKSEIKDTFVLKTTNKDEILSMEDEDEDAQQHWNNLKKAIENSTKKIPITKKRKNNHG